MVLSRMDFGASQRGRGGNPQGVQIQTQTDEGPKQIDVQPFRFPDFHISRGSKRLTFHFQVVWADIRFEQKVRNVTNTQITLASGN